MWVIYHFSCNIVCIIYPHTNVKSILKFIFSQKYSHRSTTNTHTHTHTNIWNENGKTKLSSCFNFCFRQKRFLLNFYLFLSVKLLLSFYYSFDKWTDFKLYERMLLWYKRTDILSALCLVLLIDRSMNIT